jgi:hypothetical protein
VNIFSFSLDFAFASLNFDHPQKKKNQSMVLLNPSFLLVPFCLYLLTLTGDGRLHLQQKTYILWMI